MENWDTGQCHESCLSLWQISFPPSFQERMMLGQHNGQGFHMTSIPTFEETIANLPYDAMQLQRTVSHPSGTAALFTRQMRQQTLNDQRYLLWVNPLTTTGRVPFSQENTLISFSLQGAPRVTAWPRTAVFTDAFGVKRENLSCFWFVKRMSGKPAPKTWCWFGSLWRVLQTCTYFVQGKKTAADTPCKTLFFLAFCTIFVPWRHETMQLIV